jgi:hypothetical protein
MLMFAALACLISCCTVPTHDRTSSSLSDRHGQQHCRCCTGCDTVGRCTPDRLIMKSPLWRPVGVTLFLLHFEMVTLCAGHSEQFR